MTDYNTQALNAYQLQSDCEDARSDALDAAEESFEKEMVVAFTQTMRKVERIKDMQLPCITNRAPYRETTHCAEDTVQQLVCCDNTWKALDKLVRKSDCPLAEELRKAMAKDYSDQYAKEIAAYRVGDGLDYMRRCGAI